MARCSACGVAWFCDRRCQELAWKGHRPFCKSSLRGVEAADIAEGAASHFGLPSGQSELFLTEAKVQEHVLSSLGVRDGGVVGQRPLDADELAALIGQGKRLARRLFGRNAFEQSCLPAMRVLSDQLRWPMLLVTRGGAQANLTEIPTLEVVAAVVTRVLCAARRVGEAGHKKCLFLGIGSGDALFEASVALHLGAVLQQPVDLNAERVSFEYEGVELGVVASDTPDTKIRYRNNCSRVKHEMHVFSLDRREAVQRFAEEAPLYIFSCWMPMRSRWRADIEEDAGARLVELCFLSAPLELISVSSEELHSRSLVLSELFPKTCSRLDFEPRRLPSCPGAGLFHSQLYVFTPPTALPPFLAPPLTHSHASYGVRMLDPVVKGLDMCRSFGLYHMLGPEDLHRAIPAPFLLGLRAHLTGEHLLPEDRLAMREHLGVALECTDGEAHSQLTALLRESSK